MQSKDRAALCARREGAGVGERAGRARGVTASEVARRAGVSQSTVSRVFNTGSGVCVREDARERVLRAAEELGYAPNAIAQIMASGRSGIIGVVVPSCYNIFYYHVLQTLTNTLKRYGLRTMAFTSEPSDDIDELLKGVYQYQVDGAIVTSAALSRNVTGRWNQKGMPVVLFNSDLPGAELSIVQSDHFGSGVMMADYLVGTGHRSFAYVSAENSPHLNCVSRQEGFVSRLQARGFACQIVPAAFTYESGLEAGRMLLSQARVPEAVFCGGDVSGFGVIDAVRRCSKLRLGEDISVAGYDAPIIADLEGYSMTALSQQTGQLAVDAVELLLEMIERPDAPPVVIQRPMKLVIRASTRRRESKTGEE